MEDEKDSIKDMAETEAHKDFSSNGEMLFNAVAFGIILSCWIFAYAYYNDDEIQVFTCPAVREMDAPVAMKKINDVDQYEAEVFFKGFIRQYVRAMYPKNSSEAEDHYRFVANHSLGKQKELYAGYLIDAAKIGLELDSGKTTDFFPLKPSSDPESVRISKSAFDSDTWVVEIDGFLNNRVSALEDDRGIITLRLEVIKDKARLDGSHTGLYVNSVTITTMTDPVANNNKTVE